MAATAPTTSTTTSTSNQYEAMFLLGPAATADAEGGINLCRSMIERHGGHIDLRSSGVAEGSTVLITLPSASAGVAA